MGLKQKSEHGLPLNLDQQLKLARIGEVTFLLVIQESRRFGLLFKYHLTIDVILTISRDAKRMYGTFLISKSYKNGTIL
jgi:hypothetical protein